MTSTVSYCQLTMGSAASVSEVPDHVSVDNIDNLVATFSEEDKMRCRVLFDKNKDSSGNMSKIKALELIHSNFSTYDVQSVEKAIKSEKTAHDDSIILISLEHFKSHGRFPRYPDHGFLTTTLDKIDKSTSFIVYLSHCWNHTKSLNIAQYAPSNSAVHDVNVVPDNEANDQYKLCLDGIETLMSSFAAGFERCYIFCDFTCIDQSINPAASLQHLDSIMQCCDCIFTPIANHDPHWDLPMTLTNYYEDYKTPLWNGDVTNAFLNRAWCRLELFYATNVPLYPHEDAELRMSKTKGRLAFHLRGGRRPHVLFTGYEQRVRLAPIVLAPLSNTLYDRYHPEQGYYSHPSDKAVIHALCTRLKEFAVTPVKLGYEGEIDDAGLFHGQGTYHYDNGDVYIGEWKHGKKHGVGTFQYAEGGDVYEGEYVGDHQHGLCKMRYTDGSLYCGMRKHHKNEGMGVMEYKNGDVYEGNFHKNHREGHGKMTYANGDMYDGEWKHDVRQGSGSYITAEGKIIKGAWNHNKLVEK